MKNLKDSKVTVRFSEQELEKIQTYAAKYDLTVSAFIRFSTMEAVKNASIPERWLLMVLHRILISKSVQKDKELLKFLEEVRKKCVQS